MEQTWELKPKIEASLVATNRPVAIQALARCLEVSEELDRRLAAARSSDPAKKREQSLQRELAHVVKGIERLLSAYQEALNVNRRVARADASVAPARTGTPC
jgi:chromosome segregation and condensation protein ScpB